MHCPECHSLNEDGAAFCSSCGLILIHPPPEHTLADADVPKRRAEDYAGQRRRAADQASYRCRFCGGDIEATAIRCRHCSEIIDDDYYRERANRIRARVNYASWVAYLFGLAALLVFRPVGLVSIAAGLLLSIAYYAIPVDPPMSSASAKRVSLATRLRRQLRLERIAVPIPRLKNKKLIFVGTPLLAALIGYGANVVLLQQPVDDVLKQSATFNGMSISAHYEYWVVPGVVVYDLRSLSVRQTPLDVHTALLEFAKRVRAKRFSRVDLSFRGVTKFSVDGASFQRLGEEYAKRNFDYVLYTFPRLLEHNGQGTDRDALVQFHRHWYGDDPMTRTLANGM
jgi:hypothetical protein